MCAVDTQSLHDLLPTKATFQAPTSGKRSPVMPRKSGMSLRVNLGKLTWAEQCIHFRWQELSGLPHIVQRRERQHLPNSFHDMVLSRGMKRCLFTVCSRAVFHLLQQPSSPLRTHDGHQIQTGLHVIWVYCPAEPVLCDTKHSEGQSAASCFDKN